LRPLLRPSPSCLASTPRTARAHDGSGHRSKMLATISASTRISRPAGPCIRLPSKLARLGHRGQVLWSTPRSPRRQPHRHPPLPNHPRPRCHRSDLDQPSRARRSYRPGVTITTTIWQMLDTDRVSLRRSSLCTRVRPPWCLLWWGPGSCRTLLPAVVHPYRAGCSRCLLLGVV
jgi:hypothetical protein